MRIGRAPATLAVLAFVAVFAAEGVAHGQSRIDPAPGGVERPGGHGRYANPTALVAAEIAFHRLAVEKGQWTAFRETADEAAVMFVPQPVMAHEWLKGRANPARTVDWEPHAVWMSCDGSLGVTRGAWQRADGSVGYYTTIWKRQEDGTYRWVLDQGDVLAAPLQKPELLTASVADCPDRGAARPSADEWLEGSRAQQPSKPARKPAPKVAPAQGGGVSSDGSLRYEYSVTPDNARSVIVTMRRSGKEAIVVQSTVAASSGG